MKQTVLIDGECQHPDGCKRPATIGVYRIGTDTLDIPHAITCGRHKPRLGHQHMFRNVKLLPVHKTATNWLDL